MKKLRKRWGALLLAAAMVLSLLPTAALAAPAGRSNRAEGVTIDVTEYGADPTGAKESSTAVIAALEYAASLGESEQKTLYFPKGEYHFYADLSEMRELYVSNTVGTNQSYKDKRLGILVEDMKNITVDGGGSQFIFHGNMTSFAAIRSTNVVFENFAVDYDSPSVIDVTVVSRDEAAKTAVIYVPPAYTYEIINNGTAIRWTVEGSPAHSGNNNLGSATWGQGFDMLSGITTRNVGNYPFDNVSKIEEIGDNCLKVTYSTGSSFPVVGRCYQMRNSTRTTPGAFLWECENVTLRYLDLQYLHGFGVVGQLSKTITLDHVNFAARPGTGRTSAGFADFVQMSSVGGKVTMTHCDFSNPHDDPINIHGTFLVVKEISSDRRTVTVQYMHGETAGFPQYYVGDTVDFSTKGTIIPVDNSTRTVTAVENFPNNDRTRIKVTLNEAIPDGIAVDGHVLENVTYIPEVQIDHCRFVETPTSGILVTTRKRVVIEDNYFDRMGMQAIYISCDAQSWYESGRVEDVTIRNNTFIVNPRSQGDRGDLTAIGIRPTNGTHDPNRQIHSNIKIENNTFLMAGNVYAVNAKSVNNLTVKNNKFLRYTPNVAMTLSASSQSVAVGSAQASTLSASGLSYSSRLFRLEACKNVTFENNAYDDGLNQGAALSSITTAADVTLTGDDLNVGGDKQSPAVGAVSYFSSDPTVATVNESGVVTGVKAGTAAITAYRTVAGRTFESNALTFTVTGEAANPPSKIEIGGGADAVEVNVASPAFTATVTGSTGDVAWSVKPATDGAAATITSGGVLTATAPGVVEVTASLGGVSASKLVTVKKPTGGLNDVWTVDREVAGSWTLNAESNTVTITPQNGGDWGSGDSGGHDFFLTTTPEGDFEITVRLDDYTCRQSNCWCEAGLVAFVDRNNYVSMTRKNANGSGALAISKEVGGNPEEHSRADVNQEQVYLKLARSGNTYTGAFSTDGNTWTSVGSYDASLNNARIGFYACNAGNPHNSTTYTVDMGDFKINGRLVSLVDTNTAPAVANVAAAAGTGVVNLTYDYSDADNDAETNSFIAWYVSDTADGHYTRVEGANTATLTVTAATSQKWVKAVVVPRDATGRFGAPVTSAAVEAPAQTPVQTDATLASLSAAGLTLAPAFDPNTTQYTIDLPSSAAKVTLSATATQAAARVAGTGEVTLSGTETVRTVTVTAPNGSTTKNYTVTVRRAPGSDASLAGLTAAAGSAQIQYVNGTRSYQLVAEKGTDTMNFTVTPAAGADVQVRYNGEELGSYADLTQGQKALPLAAGLNHLELRSTAADGVSNALYRVFVLKKASASAELTALTVNGTAATLPESGNDLGVFSTNASGSATLDVEASDKATVLISVDGQPVENGEAFTVTDVAAVKIRVVAEDSVTERIYDLLLSKPDPANADLYSLDIAGLTLSPSFASGTLSYTAATGTGQTTIAARATQPDATITYETVSNYKTVTGALSDTCTFFRDADENLVSLTVTSPNGKVTKTYTVDVDYTPTLYLSDMNWTSHTSGWSSGWPDPGRDIGVENKPLQLRGENGLETFQKGLGTHANSTTVFDLSGLGATRFTAKVGPNQGSGGSPHISFEVKDGNDQTLWSSNGELTHSDVYKTIDIDVTGLTTLKLVDNQTTNNANAHATWAEAKLTGGNFGPALANNIIPISYVAFAEDEVALYANAGDSHHTVTLTPTIKPDGATLGAVERPLSWNSDHTNVATVNDGVVTAVVPGTATITATAPSGAAAQCTVTVKWKLEGTPTVSGDLKYGSELTADVNTFAQDAKEHLVYTWYRGASAGGTAVGHEKTYTPGQADIGSALTVKIAGAEDSLYEGETTFTTGVIDKADGPTIPGAGASGIHGVAVATEGGSDGKIVGFPTGDGHTYEWKAVDAEESAYQAVTETEVTGLAEGDYNVRIQATDTHKAGTPITVTVAPHGQTLYLINIGTMTPAGAGTVTRRRGQAMAGEERILTVRPAEGYELAEDGLTVTRDVSGEAVQLTPGDSVTEDGNTYATYTFEMPAENVTVTATFEKKTYTIDHSELTGITCDNVSHDHTVAHGEAFTITFTPEEGLEMPRFLSITNTKTGEAFSDFTYLPDAADPAKRVVSFPHGITCDITIRAEAEQRQYTVVYQLTNGLRAPSAPQTAAHGTRFQVALEAARGYTLPEEITVTIGGAAYTRFTYDPETGTVSIPGEAVTGNVVITAEGEAQTVPLKTVTLVGPARVGRTLTVNIVPVLATVSYRWLRMDGANEVEIAGATQSSYVIAPEDEGKQIRVWVTATGGYTGQLTSEMTPVIQPQTEPFVFVTEVTLDQTAVELKAGQTLQLNATVAPDNATSPALFWSSDNEAIATVDQNGRVTAVAEGITTITAASTDQLNNVTSICQVTVTGATTPVNPSRPSGGNNAPAETTKTETRADGTKVTTVTKPDGSKTETMERPDGSKTEAVTTAKGNKTITVTDADGETVAKVQIPAVIPTPETKFEDIGQTPWAEKAVNNVAGLKLVNGTGGNKYSPVAPMTRGSLATVLHRLSQGKTDYETTFKDVAQGKYYTEGVAWAAKVGVVKGFTEEIFAPDNTITREQLAVMLARYAKLIGLDTKADAHRLSVFTDGEKTGEWAVDGVAWCVEQGILQGKGQNDLDPAANVTRAEVAVMLDRFIDLLK